MMLGIELNQVHDLDILMEQILTEARIFVNADAGSIYIRDGNFLDFTYTQNDTLQKRLGKGEKLVYSTFRMPIDKKSIAGYVAATGRPLNIPNAYEIEATLPYSFSKSFDETSDYTTRSILTIALQTTSNKILGILQIINTREENNQVTYFSKNDEITMTHFASIASVAIERAQMTRAILLRMIRMAEMRDPGETGLHVNRVGGFAVEIYEKWAHRHKLSQKEIDKNKDALRMAAMLHDVGKVAISDLILKKSGKFNDDEYEIMKQHTIMGAQLFVDRQSGFDDAAAQVALNHHERWDGSGYPGHVDMVTGMPIPGFTHPNGKAKGKKGEEIHIFGRIVALVDVFDALSSKRAYKEAWAENDVLTEIRKNSGSQFDPELVDIFFSSLDMIRAIQRRYPSD